MGPPNNRMQLTRSAPLQGRLAPPSQLIRVLDGPERNGEQSEGRWNVSGSWRPALSHDATSSRGPGVTGLAIEGKAKACAALVGQAGPRGAERGRWEASRKHAFSARKVPVREAITGK